MNSSKTEIDDTWTMDDSTESPYANILHTNCIPSESQQQEIKTYISGPEAQLQNLEAEMARMRATLKALESEHAKLKQFVDSHKALLSPMRRLVPELLQEIFVRCLPARNCVMDTTESPLLLSRICSEWRAITLSTPEIWSSLHIPIPRRFPATDQGILSVLEKAKRWLARSGEYPLSISLYFSEKDKDDFPPVIEFLRLFMHRFRGIQMRVPWELLSDLGSLDSPDLAEIAINLYDTFWALDFNAFSILKHTPSLRRVTIGVFIKLDEASLLPLNQLDELHLQCPYDVESLLNMLEQCSNLRQISLATPFLTGFIHPITRLVTLPNLHTLSMETEDMMIEFFLRAIVVPGLQTLIVNHSPLSIVSDVGPVERCRRLYPALSSMINRSSCSLKRIKFPHMQVFPNDIIECLFLMPGLIDLELFAFNPMIWQDSLQAIRIQTTFGNPLLRILTPTSDTPSTCLLPNLQRLKLSHYDDTSDKVLLDFVHSRRRSGQPEIARLTSVQILRFDDDQGHALSPEFMSLRDDGLNIKVEDVEAPARVDFFDPWDGLNLMDSRLDVDLM